MRNKIVVAAVLMVCAAVFIFIWRMNLSAQQTEEVNVMPGETQQPVVAEASSGNITVDFKNADIQVVLRTLALKSGVNIVAADNVRGSVTIRLVNVPWDVALETILRTYDYAYERVGNVITVSRVKDLTEQKENLKKLFEVQPVVIEVFQLKFLNAGDVKKVIDPLLSPRGKVAVLYRRGQKGWGYARLGLAKGEAQREEEREIEKEEQRLSKTLVVIDIPPYVEKIGKTIQIMDAVPRQVFIETRLVEVKRNKLKDIGFDFSTGSVSSFQLNPTKRNLTGGTLYNSNNVPAPFSPESDGIRGAADPTTKLFNTGLNLVYKKIHGYDFEVIMHALEEDVNANVLSAPKIRTLDGQEASILVGTKYPILESDVNATTTGSTTSASLDYYQDIGIQLLVVPQVNADGYINMIVHPVVSDITGYVNATIGVTDDEGGGTLIQYPIIQVREAQTQILLRSGDTIVIGGLLKDAKAKGSQGIPFLKDIPLLGLFFRRDTNDLEKVDLLIFITAFVLDEDSNELTGRDKARFDSVMAIEKGYDKEAGVKAAVRKEE